MYLFKRKCNNSFLIVLILIVSLVVLLGGYSYAYFSKAVVGSNVDFIVGTLSYNLSSLDLNEDHQITIDGQSEVAIDINIESLVSVKSKYQLYYTSDNDISSVTVAYFSNSIDSSCGEINSNEIKNVSLFIKNEGSSEVVLKIGVVGGFEKNSIDDIYLESYQKRISEKVEKEKVKILGKNFILEESTASFPDFTSVSSDTNGKGIYKYSEDGKDVYYFRGAVDDNHVVFGGYCWKMLRTTKTGGVKMVYDGEVVDGVCSNTGDNSQLGTSKFNTSVDDNAYVGYMYGLTGIQSELTSSECIKLNSSGDSAEISSSSSEEECSKSGGKWVTTAYEATHVNVVNSTIKNYIDDWFSSSNLNSDEYLKRIEDAVYCNDRSVDTTYKTGLAYGSNVSGYMSRYRLYTNKTPSLDCTNLNDRFTVSSENGNGDLTYPVGLLTADEMVLAGSKAGSVNSSYYLSTGNYYWTMSPYYFYRSSSYNFYQTFINIFTSSIVNVSYGVRPVISLLSDVNMIVEGDGSENNPYIVN